MSSVGPSPNITVYALVAAPSTIVSVESAEALLQQRATPSDGGHTQTVY